MVVIALQTVSSEHPQYMDSYDFGENGSTGTTQILKTDRGLLHVQRVSPFDPPANLHWTCNKHLDRRDDV